MNFLQLNIIKRDRLITLYFAHLAQNLLLFSCFLFAAFQPSPRSQLSEDRFLRSAFIHSICRRREDRRNDL